MTAFSRTLRALESDGFRGSLAWLAVACVVLCAWTVWLFAARISRFEVSDSARLEVNQASYVVGAPVAGRVLSSGLELGRQVAAGDALLEIEADSERLQAAEERSRMAALEPRIASLKAQIAALEEARSREQQATGVALEEARAKHREAEAVAHLAVSEAERLSKLQAEGLIPKREFEHGQMERQRAGAAAESLKLVIAKLEREGNTRLSDREADLKRLAADISELEGERSTLKAAIGRLEYEISRRVVRAPVSGKLGDIAVIRPGAVVQAGEKLGSIVPPGRLQVIAEFVPAAALGRVKAGQPARLRLTGFPWAQYGSVGAAVSSVGSEIRDGKVRVELTVRPEAASRIPAQHGLPGSVEVEVERISPAYLMLRAAGRFLSEPRESF